MTTGMTSPAALQGASLAFHKRKPSAPVISPSRSNGALTAATLSAQSTGTSIASSHLGLPPDRNVIASRLQQLGHGGAGGQHQFLEPPGNKGLDGKNASFIAATLAASRSVSPSPRRRVSAGSLSAVEERERVVDEGSIATAGSLINMFEGGRDHGRIQSPDATPRRKDTRPRSLTPSPAPEPASQRLRQERSPRRQVYNGIPTKLAPNGLPPKPSKPPKPVVRSISPPNPRIKRRAPTGDWPPHNDREEPDPPFGNTSRRPSLKPSPRPITPPPKPLAERQPRTPRVENDGLKRSNTVTQSPSTLSRKPSKPPKPTPRPKTPPRELPVRNTEIESVSVLQRKQSPPKSPTVRTPKQPAQSNSNSPTVNRSQTEILSPKPTRVSKPHLPPPTPPQYQRGVSRPVPEPLPQSSPGDPQKKDTPSKPEPPTPPKPRGSTKIARTPTSSSRHSASRPKTADSDRRLSEADSSKDVFVSAPTSPDYSSPPHPLRKQSTAKSSPSPTRLSIYGRRPSHAASTSTLNLDSLTSAMMAGSLAASRLTPSNTGSSLPPPSRQRSPRLRQTMRKTAESSDSEEDKHKKGRRRAKFRSGKHVHHEGSRKKWRDEIRARERKRYEAVWASNRGLHLHTSKQQDQVANVVVRDIWRRSRLPEDELGEVWDAVDKDGRGTLGRAEFVVGMWLIDQRLRGRKIPRKVSESVWGSANGVRVLGPKVHKGR